MDVLREPKFEKSMKSNQIRFFYTGTIDTAKCFSVSGYMLVHYAIELPPGWEVGDKKSLYGITYQVSYCTKQRCAAFSFPFELDVTAFKQNDFIQVDSWGRQQALAYGSAYLPFCQGTREMKVPMWKPRISNWRDNLNSFFLGTGPKLENIYAAKPETKEKVSTHFPLQAESAGTLSLTVNLLVHDGDLNNKSRVTVNESPVNKALDEIMEAFQRAKKRLQEARSRLETDK